MMCTRVALFLSPFFFYLCSSLDTSIAHVPFDHVGQLYTVDHLVILQPVIDLSVLWDRCGDITRETNVLMQTAPVTASWLRPSATELHRHCVASSTWLGTHTELHRHKRQLFALAAVGGVLGGLGLSSLFHSGDTHTIQYHQHEIEALSRSMKSSSKLILDIGHTLQNLSDTDHHIHTSMIISDELTMISSRLHAVLNGLVSLAQGNLTPALVSPDSINDMWTNISIIASQKHLEPPFPSHLNLYELPVTFSLFQGQVTINIAVPLSSGTYKLYKFIPFPILMHKDGHFLPVLPSPAETHIAVDHAGANHFPLSRDSISPCIIIGNNHFCSHLLSLSTPTCIHQLFFGKMQHLSSFCPLMHYPYKIATHLVSTNSLLVSLHLASHSYQLDCPNGTLVSKTLHPGHQLIPLSRECSIASDLFKIPAFSVSRLRTLIRSSPLHLDTSFSPAHSNNIDSIIQEAESLGKHSQHISSYIKSHPLAPSHFDILSSSTFLFLTVLFICLLVFLYYKAAKISNTSSNS